MDIINVNVALWVPLTILALFLLYRYLTLNYDTWSKQGVPGPKPMLFFGTLLGIINRNITDFDMSSLMKYGRIVGTYMGRQPELLVSDPEFLRKSMISEFTSLPNRRKTGLTGPLKYSLLALEDNHWKHVRSAMTPTFTSGKLKKMMKLIEDCADRLVEHFSKTEGKSLVLKEFCGGYTMDVIASTAFGIQVDTQSNPDSAFLKYGRRIIGNPDRETTFRDTLTLIKRILLIFLVPTYLRPLLAKLGVSFFDEQALAFFEETVNQILAKRDVSDSERRDFVQLCLDQLVEPKNGAESTVVEKDGAKWSTLGMTKSEILGNAIVFLLAGFDTTAQALQFFFYEMVMNPEIQQKVYEDMRSHSVSDKPSYDEIASMQYLDWCIQESLRLYPPAIRFDRRVDKEVTIDGITLPRGCVLSAASWALHYNPEIWTNPDEFIPERFSPENKESRHPCAWIPFGIGNRNCIGMRLALLEMKIAIIRTLWNFKLLKCESTPPKPLKFKPNLALITVTPIQVLALPRNGVTASV